MTGLPQANQMQRTESGDEPWLDASAWGGGSVASRTAVPWRPCVSDAHIQARETLPVAGDQTPWCGAFLGWVMSQAGLLDANWQQGKALLMLALNWQDFGAAVDLPASNPSSALQPGDVCVLRTPGGHHVGPWIANDAQRARVVGGNQGQSGTNGVTLVPWALLPGTIVAARRVVAARQERHETTH